MLINNYSLVLLPIGLTALAIYNPVKPAATAYPFDLAHPSKNARVGFNPQIVQILWTANRAQQAYYLEQAKFARNSQELAKSGFTLPDRDNYRIDISSKDKAVFMYGIPLHKYGTYKQWTGSRWEDAKEPLYSYISAIAYLEETGSFESILCVSKTIGAQKLARPEIAEDKFICSKDTEKIS